MIPFLSSKGGGCHDTRADVESTATTVTLCGTELGAIYSKKYDSDMRERDREYTFWLCLYNCVGNRAKCSSIGSNGVVVSIKWMQ